MSTKFLYLSYLLEKWFFTEDEKNKILQKVDNTNINHILVFLSDYVNNIEDIKAWYQNSLNKLSKDYLNELEEENKKLIKQKQEKLKQKLVKISEQEEKEKQNLDLLLNNL